MVQYLYLFYSIYYMLFEYNFRFSIILSTYNIKLYYIKVTKKLNFKIMI